MVKNHVPGLIAAAVILVGHSNAIYAQELDGQWSVNETVDAEACGEGVYTESFTATLAQSGNQVAISAAGITRDGTLNDNVLSFSASYPEEGGTNNTNGHVTFNGNSFTGSSSWTWTGENISCSGTSSLSGDLVDGSNIQLDNTPEPDPNSNTAIPILTYSLSGTTIDLSWSEVANAQGYLFFYAPYPSADPVSVVDMGAAQGVITPLPEGLALYVAVQAYGADWESGPSNIEHFEIPTSHTPAAAIIEKGVITMEPATLSAISKLPPDDVDFIDHNHANVSRYEVYNGNTLLDTFNKSRCGNFVGDRCHAPFFDGWSTIRTNTKWGDQVAIRVVGLTNDGVVVSESTSHFWTYVPDRIEFTLDENPTVRLSARLQLANEESFLITGGQVSSYLEARQNGISLSLNGSFIPLKQIDFVCPDIKDEGGRLTISTKAAGPYNAHAVLGLDSNCSGYITSGAEPLNFSNGKVWELTFSAQVKREIIGSPYEIRHATGRANFFLPNSE